MRLTIPHSSAETGCTESRELLTSTMSFSDLVALISASVTGFFTSLTAATSTHSQMPVPSVEFRMRFGHHLDHADDAPLFA